MAVLKDLIVHGSSRFLNAAYYNKIKANDLAAEEGYFNKLVAVSGKITDLNVDDLTAQNATVIGLLDVKGELHTNSWTNANIATIDGSFYITPTVSCESGTFAYDGTNITVTAGSNQSFGVDSLYTYTTSGSATTYTSWPQYSRVLLTGEVKLNGSNEWQPLGTIRGQIVSSSTSSIKINSLYDSQGASSIATLTNLGSTSISNASFRKVKVSLYERASNSTSFFPIGIYMTALGSKGKTFIDIYGGGDAKAAVITNSIDSGAMAKPVLRIGNLSGLPKVGTVTPSGWGIYTTNGFFSGTVVAKQGIIGSGETAWTIGSGSGTGSVSYIYAPTTGPTSKTANTVGMYIGTDGINNFNTSSQYVRIYNGKIYAQGAEITGAIVANSLNVGNSSDSNHLIYSGGTIDLSTDWLKFDSNTQTVSIGKKVNSKSFQTKIDSDTFWITNGTIDIAYIGNGNEITDTFISDGTTMEYELSSTYSSGGVFSPSTVSGTKKSGENKIVISSGLPEEGKIFTYTYMPSDPVTYYTMGYRTNDSAVGIYSFVEGDSNIASGKYSHAEGWINTASGSASHAEGSGNTASGKYSHAEGGGAVQASGDYSHAEGNHTEAKGKYSHAEGTSTTAYGYASHAEGYLTEASNDYAHSEGSHTHAFAEASHAEGYNTTAMLKYSHAQNQSTIANKKAQTAIGVCNIIDNSSTTMHASGDTTYGNYAFIIGNGYVDSNSSIHRSNALTVDWNGTITANGYICNNIGGNSTQTHGNVIHTWFQNHKTTIARNALLSYWSSAYGNGSQYFGYFLNGYDTSPYGGFFVCHYTTPWYVGISNGNYTQYELTRTATSSRKTKENIKSMTEKEAKKLYDLNVISFDYKKEYEEGKKNQFGLIAEDCDEVIPYVVNKPDDNKDSIWGIDYVKFVPYLIKNLQLHEETIEKLNDTVQQLVDRVDKLESEIKTLKNNK